MPTKAIRRAAWVAALLLLAALAPAGGRAASPDGPASWQAVLTVVTPAYRLDAGGVHVDGYTQEDRPGAPALPVWRTVVELPAAGDWRLAVETPGWETLPLERPLARVPAPEPPPGEQLRAALPGIPAFLAPEPVVMSTGSTGYYPSEPVSAGPEQVLSGRRLLPIRVYPLQYDAADGTLRYYREITVTVSVTEEGRRKKEEGSADDGRLKIEDGRGNAESDGDGVRVRTGERGLHRLTYDDLAAAGAPVAALDPAALAMTYLGEPVDIRVTGDGDGRFDAGDLVIFYAEPYEGRYMAHNVYRLAWGGEAGGRMAERLVEPTGAEPVVGVITRTLRLEHDRVYYSTYPLPQDADHFFDAPLFANAASPVVSTTYVLAPENPAPAGELVLRAALHGGADRVQDPDQSVAIGLNGRPVGVFRWDGNQPNLVEAVAPAGWLEDGAARVTLEAALDQLPGLDNYWVSPDWVELSYPALPQARQDRLTIEGFIATGHAAQISVTGFGSPTVHAYDVRDPRKPIEIKSVFVEYDGSSFAARLWDAWPAAEPPPAYVLSSDAGLLPPLAVEPDAASGWRSPGQAYEYIAIVHRDLWEAIQPLLDHRTAEGLTVAKVNVQDVYDEFSFGRVDPQAIRDFLSYAYHNWNAGGAPPRYVLLVGDGHYDFKGALRPDLPNLIPPYLVHIDPWIGETAADNRYVAVDGPGDYLPDMHIGRIPAKSPADVAAATDKILAYELNSEGGAWQRRVVFVADSNADPDGDFHALSDQLRLGGLPPGYVGTPVYYRMDAAHDTPEEMRAAIAAAFDQRSLILQWFGHASRQRWGSVAMFDILDPPRLAANTAWPFTTSYACWSGYFINITGSRQYGNSELSLGEALLLAPGRGSVADLSPSGLHVGDALAVLNQGLVNAVLRERIGRAGQAVDAAKAYFFSRSTAWHDVIDTSILFGDPATRLRLPDTEYVPAARK